MKDFRYLANVSTLQLNRDLCVGCGQCRLVCPHGVFGQAGGTVELVDRDGCMECGACALNCPVGALVLSPGVGCASYIIKKWLASARPKTQCSPSCC